MVQNRKKNHGKNSHLIIYFPMCEGVSERVNEWAQRSAWAKRVGGSKRTSERTSEWPSTLIWVLDYSGPHCSWQFSISSRSRSLLFPLMATVPGPSPIIGTNERQLNRWGRYNYKWKKNDLTLSLSPYFPYSHRVVNIRPSRCRRWRRQRNIHFLIVLSDWKEAVNMT